MTAAGTNTSSSGRHRTVETQQHQRQCNGILLIQTRICALAWYISALARYHHLLHLTRWLNCARNWIGAALWELPVLQDG